MLIDSNEFYMRVEALDRALKVHVPGVSADLTPEAILKTADAFLDFIRVPEVTKAEERT